MRDTLPRRETQRPMVQDASVRRKSSDDASDEDALDKSLVAELSPTQISRMACSELVRAIQAAKMSLLCKDVSEHLELYDRETLERLVYLARRCCRNQGY
jgi:hypothetical protein